MNTDQTRAIILGAGYIIMLLSGILLRRGGKPYGTLVFTIHKIIGVGAAILLYLIIKQIYQSDPLSSLETTAVIVMVLFFVATVVTGSLLSLPLSSPMPDIVSKLNKIFPYLTVLSSAAALYLLLFRN
jgi:DMSO reductase anchor subunit